MCDAKLTLNRETPPQSVARLSIICWLADIADDPCTMKKSSIGTPWHCSNKAKMTSGRKDWKGLILSLLPFTTTCTGLEFGGWECTVISGAYRPVICLYNDVIIVTHVYIQYSISNYGAWLLRFSLSIDRSINPSTSLTPQPVVSIELSRLTVSISRLSTPAQ